MKKYIYGLSILSALALSACDTKVELKEDFFGHYVTTDVIEAYKKDKNFADNSLLIRELVFDRNDSTLSYFEVNKMKKDFSYVPTKKNTIVIPNFFGSLVDASININKDELLLTNINTNEQYLYKKIKMEDLEYAKEKRYMSYAIPYLNNIIIKGKYLNMGTDTISFDEKSEVRGLKDFYYYSICFAKQCREFNKGNTIFFSDIKNEGDFYEYEFKGDSLYIYKLDELKSLNRQESKRTNVIVAAKKIN